LTDHDSSEQPGLRLDGQTFAVSGASRGIGREYSLLLARLGANVVVNSVSAGSAQRVVEEIQALGGTAVAVQNARRPAR